MQDPHQVEILFNFEYKIYFKDGAGRAVYNCGHRNDEHEGVARLSHCTVLRSTEPSLVPFRTRGQHLVLTLRNHRKRAMIATGVIPSPPPPPTYPHPTKPGRGIRVFCVGHSRAACSHLIEPSLASYITSAGSAWPSAFVRMVSGSCSKAQR